MALLKAQTAMAICTSIEWEDIFTTVARSVSPRYLLLLFSLVFAHFWEVFSHFCVHFRTVILFLSCVHSDVIPFLTTTMTNNLNITPKLTVFIVYIYPHNYMSNVPSYHLLRSVSQDIIKESLEND